MVSNNLGENPGHIDEQLEAGLTPHFVGDTSQEPRRPQFLVSEQLLFGIMALKNNFISREQLVAGFDAWIQNKCRNLAEVLEQQQAMDEDGNTPPAPSPRLVRFGRRQMEKTRQKGPVSVRELRTELADVRLLLRGMRDRRFELSSRSSTVSPIEE